MNLGVNSQNQYAYLILSIDASQSAFASSIKKDGTANMRSVGLWYVASAADSTGE
jgi:hypothetical protein